MVYPSLGVAVVATELEELRKYTEEFFSNSPIVPSIPKKIRSDLILLMTTDEKTYNRRNLTNHPLWGSQGNECCQLLIAFKRERFV